MTNNLQLLGNGARCDV